MPSKAEVEGCRPLCPISQGQSTCPSHPASPRAIAYLASVFGRQTVVSAIF